MLQLHLVVAAASYAASKEAIKMITARIKKERLLRLLRRLAMTVLRSLSAATPLMLLLILGFIAIVPPLAQAAVPRYINYQGKLTDADDNPVTGDVSITIRIYDAATGGTALWTEKQTVTVTRGIFSILLGNTTALTSLDFNSAYWYSVEVASDGEMTPRQRLTSVGYAINADKLDGYDASQFLRADADTSLTGALTVSGSITGSANGDITLDPTGTGNIVMKIDSTSGDFKVTDGTTNFVLVDNATGNVTMSNDLTVSGTIYGTLASTGGNSTFSSIVVTGTSNLRGEISNSTGAVTIADALTQTGSTNQVTFGGNVDANNGLDITGALTVSGATTLSSALDMNSNIDLDYSGTSAALDVTQASTGPSAQFSGGRVVVGASEASNAYALSTGELYVQGDLEVDGTLYGNVSSIGTTALGDATLSSLTVTDTSDLKGNISNSTGALTIADNLTVSKTDSSTSGTVTLAGIQPVFQDSGTNSTTTAIGLNVAPTVNYTGATKTGSYTALKIAATETSLPTGSNYLIDAYAGSTGTTQVFYVDNSGNAKIFGALNMNSQRITNVATPTAGSPDSDVATKGYADSITPASAGGWTDAGTGVYLLTSTDNVGIGTSSTGTYKLNVSGSTNTTSFYINGTQVNATAANLNELISGGSTTLHTHDASGISGTAIVANPTSDQTITAQSATVTPLILKGASSQSDNLLEFSDSSSNLLTYVDPSGRMLFDLASGDYALAIAENLTAGARDSAGLIRLGRNATDDWETIGYDPTLGTKGKFTFSAPLQVEASSPTGITFVEKNSQGTIIKSQGLTYDPSVDEFSFTGGKLKQAFQNLIRNGSFETSGNYVPGWLNHNTGFQAVSATYYKFGAKSVQVRDDDTEASEGFKYIVPQYDRFLGEKLTFSVWARTNADSTTASIGYATASAATNASQVQNISVNTTWTNFTMSFDVPTGATAVYIYLYGAAGQASGNIFIADASTVTANATCTDVYYDGITLIQGAMAMDYGPSPVLDTGNQLIYGDFAIGAQLNPSTSGEISLIFGEPPNAFFEGGYTGWGGEAGMIKFRKWSGITGGEFFINRSILIADDLGSGGGYGASFRVGTTGSPEYTAQKNNAYISGRLEIGGAVAGSPTNSAALIVGSSATGESIDNATTQYDAYIKGKVESDGGFYGDGSNLTNLSGANMSGTAAITGTSNDTFAVGANTDETANNIGLIFGNAAGGFKTITYTGGLPVKGFAFNDDILLANSGLVFTTNTLTDVKVGNYDNHLVDTSDPHGASMSVSTKITTPKIDTASGALTLNPATGLNVKLGDAAGTNKFAVQDSASAEVFSVDSDGTLKIDGGYTGVLGGGITLEPDGDIYFDGNIYQKGTTYTVDTVRFTGSYDVALVSKFGVGADGADANFLQIDGNGVITKAGAGNGGAVTINDMLTQTDSSNQVTFQGNVDATNGLDVSGAGLTSSAGLSISGNLTGSATLVDIDKAYVNNTSGPASNTYIDHTITRAVTGNVGVGNTWTVDGAVMTINATDTQTSGTLTDNSTLLKLQTGANAGASGYFLYAVDNAGTEKFSIDKDGTLYAAGAQTFVGATTYDGTQIIDVNNSEAFLVRKDGDQGDVFVVNTSGDSVKTIGAFKVGTATVDNFQVTSAGAVTSTGLNAGSGLITTTGSIITTSAGVMTSAGLVTAAAGINVSGGNIAITDASNIVLNTNKITLYGATGNATLAGALTQLRSVGLIPEYDNAIVRPDGADNFGTMMVQSDTTNATLANRRSYYEWTTSEPTTQDCDIVVKYRLPDGFSSFDATAPIKLWNKVSATLGSTAVTVTMLDTLGASVTLTGGSTLQNTSWTETIITLDAAGKTFSQGGYITLIIKMSADQGKVADVGELTLKGNW